MRSRANIETEIIKLKIEIATKQYEEEIKLCKENSFADPSELTITDPTDQVEVLRNRLELVERENERLKAQLEVTKTIICNKCNHWGISPEVSSMWKICLLGKNECSNFNKWEGLKCQD